jgi:hypothetical protein
MNGLACNIFSLKFIINLPAHDNKSPRHYEGLSKVVGTNNTDLAFFVFHCENTYVPVYT